MTRLPIRRLPLALATTLLLGLGGAALAQPHPQPDPQPHPQPRPQPNPRPTVGLVEAQRLLAQADVERRVVINEPHMLMFAAGEMGAERVVKGAPYCAEAVHETVQWLPDGSGGAPNRITRQVSTHLCRDAEGRTRQEMGSGKGRMVYLRDPVSGESWVLDPERKTARRMGGATGASIDADAWREYGQRMRDWARAVADRARAGATGATGAVPPAPPAPPAPVAPPAAPAPPLPPVALQLPALPQAPQPVVITRTEGGPRDVQVNMVRRSAGDSAADANWAVAPPAVLWRAQSWAPRGAGSVSPLGGKDFDGLRAHGERTTWVIEAGRVGNEKPIQITRDVWTAPELMVTLSSRDFDPRSGEVNYRLKNVRRGEPDAALMRVPADYTHSGGRSASGASTPARD